MTPQPNGGTPRTDAKVTWRSQHVATRIERFETVPASLARELERELAEAKLSIISVGENNSYWKARVASTESALSDLRAENARLREDAERWRNHTKVLGVARLKGALWVTLRMEPEASGTDKVWSSEFVIGTNEMDNGPLRNRVIGLKVQARAEELFAAIDAALSARD